MFKSKIFRYCAIATFVVATSGAVIYANSSTTSQSQAQTQAQSSISPQPQVQITNKPSAQDLLPESEKIAELPIDSLAERGNNVDMPSGRVLKQLNLSPEQLQKLKTIRDRQVTQIRDLGQQSRQANKELRDLLAGTESSDVIRSKHTQVLNLQQELRKQHFERMLAMREILTLQQRSQLNEIMQKHRPNQNKREWLRGRS
ncbi:MAG: Spy/CpxP family protein refolding chaperone [Pseudanabaena sp. ELA645]|jgi:Spy/CpxP family protein refolding chaperone